MPDDQDVAGLSGSTRRPGTRPAFSADVVRSLREAFQGEVDQRLPRVRSLQEPDPDPELLALALRDVHALASSATVVGETEAARCARTLEAALATHLQEPTETLPPAVTTEADRLATLLEGWRAA